MTFSDLATDGQPVFADGLSRRQWLEATKDERKRAFINELLHPADEDDWDFIAPEPVKVQVITPNELAEIIEEVGPHFQGESE